MEIASHLRRICRACQCPPGNKRFHADIFKQRQVSRVIPPVMESSRPISESAFMRARSASPTVARWPVHHDRDDKWPAARQYDASRGRRPASSYRTALSEFHPAALCHCVAFSTVASGAAQMMVIQLAPAPNACCASVSPASATFQSATMILSGHCSRKAFTAPSPSFKQRMVPASTISTLSLTASRRAVRLQVMSGRVPVAEVVGS